jgi:hypothetical protein
VRCRSRLEPHPTIKRLYSYRLSFSSLLKTLHVLSCCCIIIVHQESQNTRLTQSASVFQARIRYIGRLIPALFRPDALILEAMSSINPPGIDELWIQHYRRIHSNRTPSWACIHCPDKKIFHSSDELWNHALQSHQNELPQDESERQRYRTKYELDSEKKDS